jgi:hypothetical protein
LLQQQREPTAEELIISNTSEKGQADEDIASSNNPLTLKFQ